MTLFEITSATQALRTYTIEKVIEIKLEIKVKQIFRK